MAYFCSKCGYELRDKNSCCPNCRTWHGSSSSMKNKAISNCKKCGRELVSGTLNCSYCWTYHTK